MVSDRFVLAPGAHLQIYLDAIPATSAADRAAKLDAELEAWRAIGVAGVILHGFPRSLPSIYDVFAGVVANHGFPCGVAMGLDEAHVDATAKGGALGTLAARSDCYVALADCETHYDTSPTRRDEMRELGAAFRARAPCAMCIAQPWPEPLLHATFPYEEENAFVDANAYQAYFNAWKASRGVHRYAALAPVFRAQWATLEASRGAKCPGMYRLMRAPCASGVCRGQCALALRRHRVERHRQAGVAVEGGAGLDACACNRDSGPKLRILRVHRSERELAAGANCPVLRILEDFAHRVHAEDAVLVGDERGDLRRLVRVVLFLFGIEEMLLLQDRVQLAKRLEDRGLVGEVEIAVLGEQALEHELVRGAAAKPDVVPLVMDDLFEASIVLRSETCVAERGQRIGGDGDFVVLADRNESGHEFFLGGAAR